MAEAKLKREIVRLNYLKMTPRKTRLVTDLIKGLPVSEAEAQLMLRPNRAAKPILKLLRSGMANIKHRNEVGPDNFIVRNVLVDTGPMLKRFLPRAMGRATPIHKKSNHITLILEESAKPIEKRFNILPPEKKKPSETSKKKSETKPKASQETREAMGPRAGLMGRVKKFFNRKTG